jgi:hypothetical protein
MDKPQPFVTVPAAVRAAVVQRAARNGDRPTARDLNLDLTTILRIIADRPIRRGTLALLQARLIELQAQGEPSRAAG